MNTEEIYIIYDCMSDEKIMGISFEEILMILMLREDPHMLNKILFRDKRGENL